MAVAGEVDVLTPEVTTAEGTGGGLQDPLTLLMSCVIVAAIWGCSNPFLKLGSESATPKTTRFTGLLGKLESILRVLLNWRFSIPFIINQSGSLAFNFLLGAAPMTLVSPITNSLTFVFTGITAKMLGEEQSFTWKSMLGIVLIFAGLPLCMWEQLSKQEAAAPGMKEVSSAPAELAM